MPAWCGRRTSSPPDAVLHHHLHRDHRLVVAGYSLAFTNGNAYVGDLSRFCCTASPTHLGQAVHASALGIGRRGMPTTIPETVYMMFQMTFAIITPALIVGAFADRMKFSALLHLHDAVVAADLFADRALGVGTDRLGRRGRNRAAGSTSPAAPSCTSTPASPAWSARSCWASGSATAATTWRRTTWPMR